MMSILDLVNQENSIIKYKISKFPDGQQQLTIDTKYAYSFEKPLVEIRSRLNNFLDLELICCAVASLRECGFKEISLFVPYFLGSRSDRKFEEGSNNYLKTVICPIINSLGFTKVTVLDPHSDILEACLNNFNKIDNTELVKHVLYNEIAAGPGFVDIDKLNDIILISPDAGANKKVYKLAEQIGYKRDIITCSKSRDVEGKLTKAIVPVKDTGPLCIKDFVIIDDICDGGATFINIAKELKKLHSCGKIYLVVTHGIFSKGFEELDTYFTKIFTTNSYQDIDHPLIKQLEVI